MMTYLNKRRGQSTLEYAVLMIVIIAALIAIQTYIKRGVQGRLKSASDDIGDQFSPGNTNSLVSERTHSNQQQVFGLGRDGVTARQGVSETVLLNKETTNTYSKSVIGNYDKENWGGADGATPPTP